jgi:transcriptional regulator with XRE-family HTH domain
MVPLDQTLRLARAQRGLTQAAAAARIGCHTDTYHKWESGQRFPLVRHLRQVAAFTGLSLADVDQLRRQHADAMIIQRGEAWARG